MSESEDKDHDEVARELTKFPARGLPTPEGAKHWVTCTKCVRGLPKESFGSSEVMIGWMQKHNKICDNEGDFSVLS